MTNREYIKQEMKEYFRRSIEEADDEALWIKWMWYFEERVNLDDDMAGIEFLFNCAPCKRAFGPCPDQMTMSELRDPANAHLTCSGRFLTYLDMEHGDIRL